MSAITVNVIIRRLSLFTIPVSEVSDEQVALVNARYGLHHPEADHIELAPTWCDSKWAARIEDLPVCRLL